MKIKSLVAAFVLTFGSAAWSQQVNIRIDFEGKTALTPQTPGIGLERYMAVDFGRVKLYRSHVIMKQPRMLTIGSTIISRAGIRGKIVSFDITRKEAEIKDVYGAEHTLKAEELGATDGCNGAFCIGEAVVTPDQTRILGGYPAGFGKVVGLFGNNTVMVSFDAQPSQVAVFALFDLALVEACDGFYCLGDKVYSTDKAPGTIVGFYSNGNVAFGLPDGHIGPRDRNSLSMQKVNCKYSYIPRAGLCT